MQINNMHTTEQRLQTLSEIFRDIAQIFFALVFLGPIMDGTFTGFLFITGLVSSVFFWYLSLYLVK